MINRKTNHIKLATLFNMVKINSSKEVDDYIFNNKIDPDSKNDNLKISLLTSANTGMMEIKTYTKSNENALFILNNVSDPFYRNFRGNIDIFETYILSQYKKQDQKGDFINDTIYQILVKNNYTNALSIQNELFNTIENLINNDKSKKTISECVYNFFYNIAGLKDIIFNQINSNLLKKIKENDDFIEDNENSGIKSLIKPIEYHEKIIDIIYLYIDKYEKNDILKVILSFFNKDGISKKTFSPLLFKPLILLSNINISINEKEIIRNVFKKLDYTQFPLEWNSIDEELKLTLNEIKFKHPEIHADMMNYILKSNMYIKTKNKVEISEIGNNNLRKIRL